MADTNIIEPQEECPECQANGLCARHARVVRRDITQKFADFIEQRQAKNINWQWHELYRVIRLVVRDEAEAKRRAADILPAKLRRDDKYRRSAL